MATHSGTSRRHAGLQASDTLSVHAAGRLAGMGIYNAELWQVNTGGKRGDLPLTGTQRAAILEYVRQASIRAARFAPELTHTERYTLLRDAITRLHEAGIRVRSVKEQLYI